MTRRDRLEAIAKELEWSFDWLRKRREPIPKDISDQIFLLSEIRRLECVIEMIRTDIEMPYEGAAAC